MVKKFLASLAISFGLLVGTGYANIATPEYEAALSHMVKVSLDGGHGSGTLITTASGKTAILTAGHVASHGTEFDITFHDGKHAKATHGVNFADYDVAILYVDLPAGEKAKPAAISCAEPAIGSKVLIAGNPMYLDSIVTQGIIAGRYDEDGRKGYVLDATIAPGNSGGPVYDEHGRVVGVAVAVATVPLQGLPGASLSGLSIMISMNDVCVSQVG